MTWWARVRAALLRVRGWLRGQVRDAGWMAREDLPDGARLTTYNIGRGAKGSKGACFATLGAVADTIALERPDVVVLQEVHEGDVPVLVDHLRTGHDLDFQARFAGSLSAEDMVRVAERARARALTSGSTFDADHYADRHSAFGLAVLSRHPLTDVDVVRLPGGGEARIALVARTRLGDDEVTVVATHLATARNAERRDEQTRALLALAAGLPGRVIVAGDLNQGPEDVAAALAETGSALVVANDADEPTLGVRTIDHVLVGPGLEAVASRVGDEGVSDHRPVTVVLRPRPF